MNFESARAAYDAAGHVARRRLMLVVSFFSFRKKEPFVDMMVNEIPRQNFVVGVVSRHKQIGIGKSARTAFARDAPQLMPNLAGALAIRGVEAFEDRADTPIAARDERLEVRLARRFGIELDRPQLR